MICYFNKWVDEAFPIPNKSAEYVAEPLFRAYCRHGAPLEVISDQGRKFVNQVFLGILYSLVSVNESI